MGIFNCARDWKLGALLGRLLSKSHKAAESASHTVTQIIRSEHNPIITPDSDARIKGNINGPSLIRVPDWVQNPLGKYYLYFAHHDGDFIRMAHSNHVLGPYTVYTPGVLDIEITPFTKHIASPDVHVDHDQQKILMIYHGHGFDGDNPLNISQPSFYAESDDGLEFRSGINCLGPSYMRLFEWNEYVYGFCGGPNRSIWRTKNIQEHFECGPKLPIEGEPFVKLTDADRKSGKLEYRMRHPGLHLRGNELDIYYSNVGDRPERIKRTTVDLRFDWIEWKGSSPVEILRPTHNYEGVDQPNKPSIRWAAKHYMHQVRDPYLYIEGDRKYLVYSVAGEKGLGIAEVIEVSSHDGVRKC